MRRAEFNNLTVDQLISVRDSINELLSSKITAERRAIEKRLEDLNRFGSPEGGADNISGRLKPKYINPDNPAETWAGRGKTPRWMVTALKKGKRKEDFRVNR